MKHSASLARSALATMALALLHAAPATSAPAYGGGNFGVMTHFAHGWDPDWIPLLARAEIPHVRDELYWASVEPQRGVYSFPSNFDAYLAALNRHDVAPLIVLSFENPLYDGGDTPHSDEAIAAFARYAVAVLRHYGEQIKAVEIWNEYNGSFNRGPATQDRAGTYLRMLRAAYTAIKRERPDVIVAGGATAGVPLPYWEKLLAGGALDFMDALSVHPYRYEQSPEGIEDEIGALGTLVKEYNRGQPRPVWVTEIGWFTKAGTAPGDLTIDDTVQAKFLVRANVLLQSAGVERTYWYLLHDYQGPAMGLFRNDADRTPKPAATALTTLARQLRGAGFVRREETSADFYSLVFATLTGDEVRVVWSLIPTSLPTDGVTAATDLQGRPLGLGDTLRIDDSPLFIKGAPTRLPPASAAITLANAARDFSSVPGRKGWSYGSFAAGTTTFVPASNFITTDWTGQWSGPWPYFSLTATEQHPSVVDGGPVTAVRRWLSNTAGRVRGAGTFRCRTGGDGVGVSILVNGQTLFRTLLGGGDGRSVVAAFDFLQPVQPGTTIDFAVDPGPAANIDFDATALSATLTKEAP